MTCDTVKNLEREAATKLSKLTVEQAYRLADNQRAKDAWAKVMEWTGPKQTINDGVFASFKNLI